MGDRFLEEKDVRERLGSLFRQQNLAVLSTTMEGRPYTNLIAFMASDDLKNIYFATPRSTRKFENIMKQPGVSLLIDNRTNSEADFHSAITVTVEGRAFELEGDEKEEYRKQYIRRFPFLDSFINSPTVALFRVEVESYNLVTRFQQVTIYRVKR